MIAHNETVSICKMTEPVTNEPNLIIYRATWYTTSVLKNIAVFYFLPHNFYYNPIIGQ